MFFPCLLNYVLRQSIRRLREACVFIDDCELLSNVVVKPVLISRAILNQSEANYRLNMILVVDVSISLPPCATTKYSQNHTTCRGHSQDSLLREAIRLQLSIFEGSDVILVRLNIAVQWREVQVG